MLSCMIFARISESRASAKAACSRANANSVSLRRRLDSVWLISIRLRSFSFCTCIMARNSSRICFLDLAGILPATLLLIDVMVYHGNDEPENGNVSRRDSCFSKLRRIDSQHTFLPFSQLVPALVKCTVRNVFARRSPTHSQLSSLLSKLLCLGSGLMLFFIPFV